MMDASMQEEAAMSAELIAYSSDPSFIRVGLPFAGPSAENAASPLALRPSPKAQALAPPDTGGGPMSAAPDKPAPLLDAFNHIAFHSLFGSLCWIWWWGGRVGG